jgi:HNH endonuclease
MVEQEASSAIARKQPRSDVRIVPPPLIRKVLNVRNCFYCGQQTTNPKYCNNWCQARLVTKQKIQDWKEGKVFPHSKIIRKYLFVKFENKCTRCGWNEINPLTGLRPLEVEHIDGNSENNVEENLTLLCPNCHSLTPTYRALNKGNGRHKRRLRYKTGKSF